MKQAETLVFENKQKTDSKSQDHGTYDCSRLVSLKAMLDLFFLDSPFCPSIVCFGVCVVMWLMAC